LHYAHCEATVRNEREREREREREGRREGVERKQRKREAITRAPAFKGRDLASNDKRR
jgi:hypothetical protein